MSKGIELEGFEGHLVSTMEEVEGHAKDEDTFRVALIGDWSGRSNREVSASGEELAGWRPRLVDRDNLEETMAKLGVALRLRCASSAFTLDFNKLDDFHPDFIFARSELFQALRELRTRLNNPETFAEAAREVRSQLDISSSPTTTEPVAKAEEAPKANEIDGSLLDQILAGRDDPLPVDSVRQVDNLTPDLRALVQDLVRPHLLPDDSEQQTLVAAVDSAISEQMRAVLRDPDFQSLEASWRALDLLVSRLDTGVDLKLYLLDMSHQELQSALLNVATAEDCGIYRLLVSNAAKTFGGERWSLLVGNYTFDYTVEDAEVLKRLSFISAAAGTAFVAGASSRVVGCDSLAATPDPDDWRDNSDPIVHEIWMQLRETTTADHLGLALPRFLLRLPYGSSTEPTEEFEFEEMGSEHDNHELYLWGNPAFAVCYLIAQSFSQSGWDFQPGEVQEISDLPLHIYEDEGESVIKPCAEVLMTVDAANKIIERGVMPLISMKGTDTVRLGLIQSIASPPRRLAGRWSN